MSHVNLIEINRFCLMRKRLLLISTAIKKEFF